MSHTNFNADAPVHNSYATQRNVDYACDAVKQNCDNLRTPPISCDNSTLHRYSASVSANQCIACVCNKIGITAITLPGLSKLHDPMGKQNRTIHTSMVDCESPFYLLSRIPGRINGLHLVSKLTFRTRTRRKNRKHYVCSNSVFQQNGGRYLWLQARHCPRHNARIGKGTLQATNVSAKIIRLLRYQYNHRLVWSTHNRTPPPTVRQSRSIQWLYRQRQSGLSFGCRRSSAKTPPDRCQSPHGVHPREASPRP